MSSRLPAATTLKGRGPRGRARGRTVTVIITVGAAAESLALEFPLWRVRSQVFFLGGGGLFARGAPPWNKMRRFDRLNFHASVFFFFSFPTASSPIDARAPSGRGSWFLWPTQLLVALVSSGANKLGCKMCKNSSTSILLLFLLIFTFESRYFCHVTFSSFFFLLFFYTAVYISTVAQDSLFFFYSSTPKEPDIAQDLIYNSP